MARLAPVLTDVLAAARCERHELVERDALEDGVFEIVDAEFAERT